MTAPLARTAVARGVAVGALLVAVLALGAYGAALGGDYVFDDVHSVAANPALHDLGNLGRYWTDPDTFSGTGARMYRPALLTSFALNLALSPSAWSLKAGNVALHAACAALLFVWLWRLARRARAAFVVAALFAVHPLASEAINLVSARSELLSAFGVLVALIAHLQIERRSGRIGAWGGLVLGAVLACGSKETGVVLPVLLVAQGLCRRHRLPDRAGLRRTAAAVLPAVAVVVVYLIARKLLLGQATVQLLGRAGEDPTSGYGRTLTMQLLTMGTLLPGALLQALVPVGLSVDPAVRFSASLLDPMALLGWASLAGLTVAALWSGPTARLRRLGSVFAWVVAAPWIVIPLNMPLAEHRLYGPLLGLAAVAMALAPRLAAELRRRSAAVLPAAVFPAAWTLLVVLFAFGSAQRSLLYRDERLLWQHELVRHPDSFRAWWGLGTSRRRQGDLAGAIAPLALAHALAPQHYDALRHYAEALASLPDDVADPERALAIAQRLCDAAPQDPWARTVLAQAELQAGRVRGAPEHFVAAERTALSCLAIAAPKGYVYQLAAAARRGLDDLDGALAHLDASIAGGLASIGVRLDRAAVLRDLGRAADARRELLLAQREAPTDPRVLAALQALAAPPR